MVRLMSRTLRRSAFDGAFTTAGRLLARLQLRSSVYCRSAARPLWCEACGDGIMPAMPWNACRCVPLRSAVVVTAVAAGVLVLAAPAVATCTATGPAAPRQDLALEVAGLVNAHRATIGLAPLAVSPSLMRSALWKSNHMVALGYFDHNDPAPPVARTVPERAQSCGYPTSFVGENIAYGVRDPAQVMQGWLASPGHRRNIEGAGYTQIGVGAAGQARHWTQNFGSGGEAEPLLAPPVALPDFIETPEDTPVAVAVTANDTGEWLHSIGAWGHPSINAAPSTDGRALTVSPARDFAGEVVLVQRTADVAGQQAETTLTVRLVPVNDRPRAGDDRARVRRGARRVTVRVLANDEDVDGDRLSVRSSRRPRHGRVSMNGSRISYLANRRWPGRDSFSYRITDVAGATDIGVVRITGPRRR